MQGLWMERCAQRGSGVRSRDIFNGLSKTQFDVLFVLFPQIQNMPKFCGWAGDSRWFGGNEYHWRDVPSNLRNEIGRALRGGAFSRQCFDEFVGGGAGGEGSEVDLRHKMKNYKKMPELLPGVTFVQEVASFGPGLLLRIEQFRARVIVIQREEEPRFKFIKHRTKNIDGCQWMTLEEIGERSEVPAEDPVVLPEVPFSPWYLSVGCHRGTLVSRDTDRHECEGLVACKKLAAQIKKEWDLSGLQVWYMTAHGPDGDHETIEQGTPCRS